MQLLIDVAIQLDAVDAGSNFARTNRRIYKLLYAEKTDQTDSAAVHDSVGRRSKRRNGQHPPQAIWYELYRNAWDPLPQMTLARSEPHFRLSMINWQEEVQERVRCCKIIAGASPKVGIFGSTSRWRHGGSQPDGKAFKPQLQEIQHVMQVLLTIAETRKPRRGKLNLKSQATFVGGPSHNSEELSTHVFPPSGACLNAHSTWIFPGISSWLLNDWYKDSHVDPSDRKLVASADELRAQVHCLHGIRMLTGPRELASDVGSGGQRFMEVSHQEEGGLKGPASTLEHRATPTYIPAPDSTEDADMFDPVDASDSQRISHSIFHRSDDAPSSSSHVPILCNPGRKAGDTITRRKAREVVYDAGRFSFENSYGPFKPFRWDTIVNEELAPRTGGEDQYTDDLHAQELYYRASKAKGQDGVMGDDDDEMQGSPPRRSSPRKAKETAATKLRSAAIARDTNALQQAGFDLEMHTRDYEQAGLAMYRRSLLILEDSDETFRYKGKLVMQAAKRENERRWAEFEAQFGTHPNPYSTYSPWEVQVDWILVEAIMVVLYCNFAIQRTRIGNPHFKLPLEPGETQREYEARTATATMLPSGWHHSRGCADIWNGVKEDWAGVEGIWTGTVSTRAPFPLEFQIDQIFLPLRDLQYCYVGFADFIGYNAKLARWRRIPTNLGTPEIISDALRVRPRLVGVGEVADDFLQLRLDLLKSGETLPAAGLGDYNPAKEFADILAESCMWSPKFRPLAFAGTTLTYPPDGSTPTMRADAYGFAVPIYSPEIYERGGTLLDDPSNIIAIRWRMRVSGRRVLKLILCSTLTMRSFLRFATTPLTDGN